MNVIRSSVIVGLATAAVALSAPPAIAACQVDLLGANYGEYDYCSDQASRSEVVVLIGTVRSIIQCIDEGNWVLYDEEITGPDDRIRRWSPSCHAQLTLQSLTDGGAWATGNLD